MTFRKWVYSATLEKILFKLQETCYTLHSRDAICNVIKKSWAAACNDVKTSLRSLQKVESSSTASVTRCNFLCNLCCSGFARQVAGWLQRLTCPFCNLPRNCFGLATIAQSRAQFYILQGLHGICFETIATGRSENKNMI